MNQREQSRTLCALLMAYGSARFNEKAVCSAIFPRVPTAMFRLAGYDVRKDLEVLVDESLLSVTLGPRGGIGWTLTDEGVAKAKRYASKQHLHYQEHFQRRVASHSV